MLARRSVAALVAAVLLLCVLGSSSIGVQAAETQTELQTQAQVAARDARLIPSPVRFRKWVRYLRRELRTQKILLSKDMRTLDRLESRQTNPSLPRWRARENGKLVERMQSRIADRLLYIREFRKYLRKDPTYKQVLDIQNEVKHFNRRLGMKGNHFDIMPCVSVCGGVVRRGDPCVQACYRVAFKIVLRKEARRMRAVMPRDRRLRKCIKRSYRYDLIRHKWRHYRQRGEADTALAVGDFSTDDMAPGSSSAISWHPFESQSGYAEKSSGVASELFGDNDDGDSEGEGESAADPLWKKMEEQDIDHELKSDARLLHTVAIKANQVPSESDVLLSADTGARVSSTDSEADHDEIGAGDDDELHEGAATAERDADADEDADEDEDKDEDKDESESESTAALRTDKHLSLLERIGRANVVNISKMAKHMHFGRRHLLKLRQFVTIGRRAAHRCIRHAKRRYARRRWRRRHHNPLRMLRNRRLVYALSLKASKRMLRSFLRRFRHMQESIQMRRLRRRMMGGKLAKPGEEFVRPGHFPRDGQGPPYWLKKQAIVTTPAGIKQAKKIVLRDPLPMPPRRRRN